MICKKIPSKVRGEKVRDILKFSTCKGRMSDYE